MNKKNAKIVKLSGDLKTYLQKLKDIEHEEQDIANRKRRLIGKIDGVQSEIDVLSVFDEDLNFIVGDDL